SKRSWSAARRTATGASLGRGSTRPFRLMSGDSHDLVVVGGGLAGLTAGLFGARRGLSTLVVEAQMPGGLIVNLDKVEDFPGFPEGVAGFDLGPLLQEQAANAGAAFALAEVVAVERDGDAWVAVADGERYTAKAMVVAAGARLRPLGVPGEERLV